jgi:hypothetical protein
MFRRLFGNKSEFDDEVKSKFVTLMSDILKIQTIPTGGKSTKDERDNLKRKALGYVYGFIDAALQVRGQDKGCFCGGTNYVSSHPHALARPCERVHGLAFTPETQFAIRFPGIHSNSIHAKSSHRASAEYLNIWREDVKDFCPLDVSFNPLSSSIKKIPSPKG